MYFKKNRPHGDDSGPLGSCFLCILIYSLLFRFYPTRRREWPDGCYRTNSGSSGEPTDIANEASSIILYFHGGQCSHVMSYKYAITQ